MMIETTRTLLERVLLDDPMMTDAELVYQRARKPGDPKVGKSPVDRNLLTTIGGLAMVRRRLRHHEKAAEWFKSAYEAAYGSVGSGVDLEAVRVDRSIIAHDAGMANRIDRAREMYAVVKDLGGAISEPVRLLTAVVVFGCSVSEVAGQGARPRERVTQALLDALDRVAEMRGIR